MRRWRREKFVVDRTAPNKYVLIVVFEYPSKTKPVLVNVYEYPEKKDCETAMRNTKREAENQGIKLIAVRVRPIIKMKENDYNGMSYF